MATVTGLTAARMLEIEAASVVSGAIDGSGHLILTKHDGSTIDAGDALIAVASATTTAEGVVELATSAEGITGTDAVRAVSPAVLAAVLADFLSGLAITESQVTGLVTDLTTLGDNISTLTTNQANKADKASPTFTGTVTAPRVVKTPVALTDATTIAVDAALGDQFKVTLAGNRTLGNPSNSIDGQMILFAIRQDGTGGRTLALGTNYRLGSDITAITLSTSANKTDYLGCRYNGTDSKWDVIAFVKGY